VAATGATLIINQLAWVIFTFWPAAQQAVPSASDQLQLAAIAATIFTAAAGYYARHTPRPDITPVQPGQLQLSAGAPFKPQSPPDKTAGAG
jgi:hypothetical protein